MSQNPNQNPRQPSEQPQRQPTHQQPTQRPPQQQPQQQPQGQLQQSSPPTQRHPPQGQQPVQFSQGALPQGQPAPPQQGGQLPQQPPQGQPIPPSGMQQGMVSQQSQPPQGAQPIAGTQQPQQMRARSAHLQSVSLQDILHEDVVTADPDTPIPTITSQMKADDVGAVVVTENNEPLGIVTDRKIALALEKMPDLAERTAADVMSEDLVAGAQDSSVHDAIRQLSDAGIRRLPIVDEENTLVGIVTLDDIIVLLGEELQDSTEIIKHQSPRL